MIYPLEKLLAVGRRINLPITQRFAWNYQFRHHEYKPEPCLACASLILTNVPAGSTIVELGCGGGVLAQEVFRRGWRGRYIGIDLSDEALRRAKMRCPQAHWQIGNMCSALGFTPDALVMIESVYYLSPSKARLVLENANARVTICRIHDRFSVRKHADLLLEMGFQEHRTANAVGVFYRVLPITR